MSKNPFALGSTAKEWLQGANAMDIGAAVGGIAMATIVPTMLVRTADTGTQKALRLAASFASAIAAGALGKAMLGSTAGKAAVLGGMTGFGVQLLATLTGIQIGQRLLGGGNVRRLPGRTGRYPAPATESPFGDARLQ